MTSIQQFNDPKISFIQALKGFFKELHIPINIFSEIPGSPKDVFKEAFNSQNPTHALMDDVYVLGTVDDTAFTQTRKINEDEIKNADYDFLIIVGIILKNDKMPTRGQLAELTRLCNKIFNSNEKGNPVTVVFRYTDCISFSNAERIVRNGNDYRDGEKLGKVSLLKDISIKQPHRGHIAILNQLAIPSVGRNTVTNLTQLYYYWQSVFSISVLNKKFYVDIIEWFNKATNEIKIPGESAKSEKHKDFTVRLIARLIFIWFLKELDVIKEDLLLPEFGNGDENELIKSKQEGTAYYKFILQNLFFNALNREHKERETDLLDIYSSSFDNIEEIKKHIFLSPYLNGGLFDIHENDWCELDKVNNAFVVPDHLFLNKEKGLNGILARYKFTIAENTPLEEDIAVDPEMLGRIFENLLAEQSDDTKDAARKNTGAFYTPRPVVSYMCKSTLLKHLDTEVKPENGKQIIHKLLETTVLDPACGSGAFPMGMLEEMMQVLTTVDPDGKIWVSEMMKSKDSEFREHIAEMFADGQIRYIKKLGLLRNCLFGIDLLEYAIEITKLRCWLSLIVEQRVNFTKPNYNLKPLPNLEFKFYKKNSLYRFYKTQNLNQLIDLVDNENLLKELVNLENQYFIAKSDRFGTKEEIKSKIIKLLEKVVDSKTEAITKELNLVHTTINQLVANKATEKEIAKHRKKETALANELGELAIFRNTIKDYFIERVVFPGIFNKENPNAGFDIVIGNPPYVNTKQISSMGQGKKMEEEYGYCDDLYNHFTIRGLELLKKGGLLSYITSDTFLTFQTKKNMRMEFLGIQKPSEGLLDFEQKMPECSVTEIINTPKAFAALVDTAIFSLKKESAVGKPALVYIDIRKPSADSFNISESEWQQIKTSKENLAGWERILDKTFAALGHDTPKWEISHTCDGDNVYKDAHSPLLKFQLSFETYRKTINYAIFSPTEYNCQILEKIIKPARPIFDNWWSKIETSRQIENNRNLISKFNSKLGKDDWAIIGLITDGGVGLQTGDNGNFIGYRSDSRFADRCRITRVQKLWEAIQGENRIIDNFKVLADCESEKDVKEILESLTEQDIWQLFDGIKEKYGLRIFSKGYLYRIIPNEMVFDVSQISDEQKLNGIKGTQTYVPYDKGDKEGNRWYLETPYLIDWSEKSVNWLKSNSGHSGVGMPVVRNPQFYFRNGFCWSDVLNPNSSYIKCRLKGQSVNDVKSMSLYDELGLGDKYFVMTINSYLAFKILREFFNSTVAIQMNDIRKLPIKIPSEGILQAFNQKFEECLVIKKEYFDGEILRVEMNQRLKPIEVEIDEMVNRLYGIEAKEAIIVEEMEEEEIAEIEEEDE